MFWSGNFIVVRELNFLLKEENVTLSQVLEADDILQECKADNKALMQFLTRPDILSELVSLITEEPAPSVELAAQYRHASIACEVLTSPLSSLSDRLSLDTQQMNRLCDFINRDPPLNPLLASYFSKTIEMLLERNPKQDWYLYHIVCLRVLDFFKCRRDFLPNLLRHLATSAIADTFKYFIRLDDLFNKIVMEWLEEHQFIECLVQIICGTYAPDASEDAEKGTREPSEKLDDAAPADADPTGGGAGGGARARARSAAVASANACALLCDLLATGCGSEGAGSARSRTAAALAARLAGAGGVRGLLQAVFTSAAPARAAALLHGARLLRSLLDHQPALTNEGEAPRSQVELAVAPHLPLLHQALLRDPTTYTQEDSAVAGEACGGGAVGAARVQVAALLAQLASSSVEEVCATMLTLGTPGVLVDMFFQFPQNNFLHAQVLAFIRNGLANPAYRTQYAAHLFLECDLLTRLMDAFEENQNKQGGLGGARAGHMGHATLALAGARAAAADCALPPPLAERWAAFLRDRFDPAYALFTVPLGGTYPSENSYEVDNTISDRSASYYDANASEGAEGGEGAGGAGVDSAEFIADGLGLSDDDNKETAKSRFLELADQRFDDDMWDDGPEGESQAAPADDVLAGGSPWGSSSPSEAATGEGWAQFEPLAAPDDFPEYWHNLGSEGERCVSLATKLLTAMKAMSPADVANIVSPDLDLPPAALPHAFTPPHPADTPAAPDATDHTPVSTDAADNTPASTDAADNTPAASDATDSTPAAPDATDNMPISPDVTENTPVAPDTATDNTPTSTDTATDNTPAATDTATDNTPTADKRAEDAVDKQTNDATEKKEDSTEKNVDDVTDKINEISLECPRGRAEPPAVEGGAPPPAHR